MECNKFFFSWLICFCLPQSQRVCLIFSEHWAEPFWFGTIWRWFQRSTNKTVPLKRNLGTPKSFWVPGTSAKAMEWPRHGKMDEGNLEFSSQILFFLEFFCLNVLKKGQFSRHDLWSYHVWWINKFFKGNRKEYVHESRRRRKNHLRINI